MSRHQPPILVQRKKMLRSMMSNLDVSAAGVTGVWISSFSSVQQLTQLLRSKLMNSTSYQLYWLFDSQYRKTGEWQPFEALWDDSCEKSNKTHVLLNRSLISSFDLCSSASWAEVHASNSRISGGLQSLNSNERHRWSCSLVAVKFEAKLNFSRTRPTTFLFC